MNRDKRKIFYMDIIVIISKDKISLLTTWQSAPFHYIFIDILLLNFFLISVHCFVYFLLLNF